MVPLDVIDGIRSSSNPRCPGWVRHRRHRLWRPASPRATPPRASPKLARLHFSLCRTAVRKVPELGSSVVVLDEARRAGAAGDRARGLVDALCAARDVEHAAQVRQVELIGELCSEFAVLDAVGPVLPGQERLVPFGGDGAPLVAEHLATELAPKLRVTILDASVLIAEALDVLYRHPPVWEAVKAGRVPVWQAKQVASLTHAAGLSLEAVGRPADPRRAQ